DKIEDARRELRRALAIDPHCHGAHFALGYIAWSLHELSSAESEFTVELATPAHEYLAFFYLADTLEIEGRIDEAGAVLSKMGAENANTYDYHLAAGKWNERKKD